MRNSYRAYKDSSARVGLGWILAFVLPSLSGLVWCVLDARILFIAFPLLVLLGSGGLIYIENKLGKVLAIVLLAICVIFNFVAPHIVSFTQLQSFFSKII